MGAAGLNAKSCNAPPAWLNHAKFGGSRGKSEATLDAPKANGNE